VLQLLIVLWLAAELLPGLALGILIQAPFSSTRNFVIIQAGLVINI